ncbi:hypothetical protein [Enterococcus faecalis]|uniref:hypothetical protein n=1 Tax=Enterococcus faecalis TaxID=1351 RepID=UPI003D9990A8
MVIFFSLTTPGTALASMLGPVAGLVDDVVKIAQGIPLNAVEGKNMAELVVIWLSLGKV